MYQHYHDDIGVAVALQLHGLAVDLAAWQRIAWRDGPDAKGHLQLLSNLRKHINAEQLITFTRLLRACNSLQVTWRRGSALRGGRALMLRDTLQLLSHKTTAIFSLSNTSKPSNIYALQVTWPRGSASPGGRALMLRGTCGS
jgi:hypothetical protein